MHILISLSLTFFVVLMAILFTVDQHHSIEGHEPDEVRKPNTIEDTPRRLNVPKRSKFVFHEHGSLLRWSPRTILRA